MNGNVTSSFNIENVMQVTKKLNIARRGIMDACYKLKGVYNSVPLNIWSGNLRKEYHVSMFGTNNESGNVGNVLYVCSILNELLYNFACYICEVARADGTNINPDMFVDDSFVPTQINIDIPYSGITDIVATPADNFESFISETLKCIDNEINSIEDFANNLKLLETQAINDSSTSEIKNQINLLETLRDNINSTIEILIKKIEKFGIQAEESMHKVITSQANVSKKIGGELLYIYYKGDPGEGTGLQGAA